MWKALCCVLAVILVVVMIFIWGVVAHPPLCPEVATERQENFRRYLTGPILILLAFAACEWPGAVRRWLK